MKIDFGKHLLPYLFLSVSFISCHKRELERGQIRPQKQFIPSNTSEENKENEKFKYFLFKDGKAFPYPAKTAMDVIIDTADGERDYTININNSFSSGDTLYQDQLEIVLHRSRSSKVFFNLSQNTGDGTATYREGNSGNYRFYSSYNPQYLTSNVQIISENASRIEFSVDLLLSGNPSIRIDGELSFENKHE